MRDSGRSTVREGSFIAHCVSGTVDKNVQVADHSDIHKIYTLTIALL